MAVVSSLGVLKSSPGITDHWTFYYIIVASGFMVVRFYLKPIFGPTPAALKNESCFKSCQKWLKNNHPGSLIKISETRCGTATEKGSRNTCVIHCVSRNRISSPTIIFCSSNSLATNPNDEKYHPLQKYRLETHSKTTRNVQKKWFCIIFWWIVWPRVWDPCFSDKAWKKSYPKNCLP